MAAAVAVGAFVVLRARQPAPTPPAPRAQAEAPRAQDAPVFLSVVSEPLDADVTATWKDAGEKRGVTPLSLEVPRNAKVHFEFRKPGYLDYATDVIADQPQTVQAALKAVAVATPAPVAAEIPDKKPRHERKKRERAPKSSDGVVDVLGDLK